eukprot:SAG31_NODE_6063_length_2186_cov_1.771442_3_plen_223_part_00
MLSELAVDLGAPSAALDDAFASSQPKEGLIDLIIGLLGGTSGSDPRFLPHKTCLLVSAFASRLGADTAGLAAKKNSELRVMAAELGAPISATDDAMESADPHCALVELVQSLLNRPEPAPEILDETACEQKKTSELIALAKQSGASADEIDKVWHCKALLTYPSHCGENSLSDNSHRLSLSDKCTFFKWISVAGHGAAGCSKAFDSPGADWLYRSACGSRFC